jgi:hypothetical protein
MSDMAGKVVDITGNAARGDRSMGQLVANRLNTAAIARSSDSLKTAGTGDSNTGLSKDHTSVPEGRGHLRQAVQKAQLQEMTLSSDCPPLARFSIGTGETRTQDPYRKWKGEADLYKPLKIKHV